MSTSVSDLCAATPLRVLALRYFNPIGADPAPRTGLQHRVPNHALGKLNQVRDITDKAAREAVNIAAGTDGHPNEFNADHPLAASGPVRPVATVK